MTAWHLEYAARARVADLLAEATATHHASHPLPPAPTARGVRGRLAAPRAALAAALHGLAVRLQEPAHPLCPADLARARAQARA